MHKLPKVSEFMDSHVDAVTPEMDIMDVVSFLLEKRVTGAPVTDKDGKLVGIITESDCLKLLTHGSSTDYDVPKGTASDFMTSGVKTIDPDVDIYYAAGKFLSVPFRRFPVVRNGELIGAITRFDILRAIKARLA